LIGQLKVTEKETGINKIIIELDNLPGISSFCLEDGFILWLYIRYSVYNALQKAQNEIKEEPAFANERELVIGHKTLKRIKSLIDIYFSPLFKKQKFNGLVFSTALGWVENKEDGKFFSKINNYFNELPSSGNLNIFLPSKKGHHKYRNTSARIDPLLIRSALGAKLNKLYTSKDVEMLHKLFNLIGPKLVEHIEHKIVDKIKANALEFIKLYPHLNRNIKRMFKATKPEYVVMEDGNYGGDSKMVIIRTANREGIKTIEMQHGLFDIGMRYGRNLLSDKNFASHKTNFVFTFGPFWSRFINSSSIPITVGYPYLEEKIANELTIRDENTIVFISQGRHSDSLIDIAMDTAVNFKGKYRIIYRLHPSETSESEAYMKLKSIEGIEMSNSGDVYSLLAMCTYVVGIFSALLFEALLFNKTSLIYKNTLSDDHIPAEIGIRFNDARDLIRKIDDKVRIPVTSKNDFWTLNWRKQLAEFNSKEKLWI
jgi:hypothetical protein